MSWRLIFIPGMGADRRIFKHQLEYFQNAVDPIWNVTVLNWVPTCSGECLKDFALRMIEKALPEIDPKPDDRFIICGFSLGGVIAPYIARRIGAEGCVLLATFRRPEQFPRRYQWLLRPVLLVPGLTYTLWAFSKLVVFLLYSFGKKHFSENWRELLRQYLDSSALDLTRKIQMTVRWSRSGSESEQKNLVFRQIHGRRDRVIPLSVLDPDYTVSGGHLFPVFHSRTANCLIEKSCREIIRANGKQESN